MDTPMKSRTASLFSYLIASTLAFGAVSVATPASAAVPQVRKVAVVNMQSVLNKTKQGKAARKKLEAASKAKQTKLDKKRRKLEGDQAKLKNLSGQKLMKAQEQLQREALELQQVYMVSQQELAEQEARILQDIYTKCQKVVDKVAVEMGLDLVLVEDANNMIYRKDGLDITTTVVKRYDKKHP